MTLNACMESMHVARMREKRNLSELKIISSSWFNYQILIIQTNQKLFKHDLLKKLMFLISIVEILAAISFVFRAF